MLTVAAERGHTAQMAAALGQLLPVLMNAHQPATARKLALLAQALSTPNRKVSPMQVAARLLVSKD